MKISRSLPFVALLLALGACSDSSTEPGGGINLRGIQVVG